MEKENFAKVGFLVYDESLKDAGSEFVQWLRSEGFHGVLSKGCWGCSWVWVSITCRTFAYGMPGIKIVRPLGDHAITIDEFRQIYGIYKRYEGLDPLKFER